MNGQRNTMAKRLIRIVVEVYERIGCGINVRLRFCHIFIQIIVIVLPSIGQNLLHMLRIDDVHNRVGQMDSMTLDDVKEEKNCRNLNARHLEEILKVGIVIIASLYFST